MHGLRSLAKRSKGRMELNTLIVLLLGELGNHGQHLEMEGALNQGEGKPRSTRAEDKHWGLNSTASQRRGWSHVYCNTQHDAGEITLPSKTRCRPAFPQEAVFLQGASLSDPGKGCLCWPSGCCQGRSRWVHACAPQERKKERKTKLAGTQQAHGV